MRYEDLILYTVATPIIGAFLLPFAGRLSVRLRNLLSLGLILAALLFSFKMVPLALAGKTATVIKQFPLGLNFILHADSLAVFMACVSSLISALIIIYSFEYVSRYENQNEYYCMVTLFFGSMMGLVFSGNLIFIYIFWEMTAITSWRLIGFFRARTQVLAADKAFLVTVFGAAAMLIGFISIYQATGSFDLAVIRGSLKGQAVSNLAAALILVGIFSKSATLPFHTWLPDAGVAPAPVTALLHAAILVKIGVYVYARLFLDTFTLTGFWHAAIPVIAAASAIVSGGAALVDTDLKRIIAYSTISQIGFICFGLATGNGIAVAGALLYILMHGIAKAGLFLSAGIIEQSTHTRDITKLGGLITTMPVTAISFLFCSFSVMGIPPFGGFFCKYMVFAGASGTGHFLVSGAFLIGAFLTILYLFRVFNMVFLGEARLPQAREAGPVMVTIVSLLAIAALFSGIFIRYPCEFVQAAVQQIWAVIQLFAYEVPLFMSILAAALLANTWSLAELVVFYTRHPLYCLFNLAGFAISLLALLGKLEKVPFDIPEAETEIVAGAFTEYSGRRLALLRLTIDVEMVAGSSLLVAVFFPFALRLEPVIGFLVSSAEVLAVIAMLSLMRSVAARLRIDQMIRFCWKLLVPVALVQLLANLILKRILL